MRHLFVLIVFTLVKNGRTSCLDIIDREEWGALKGVRVDYIIFPVKDVIIHHTVSPECFTRESCMKYMRNVQKYCINVAHYHDIAYNFVIGGDGKVYEGVGWHKLGAHTSGYSRSSIGIAFIGNYEEITPMPKQLQALKDLLECGVASNELDPDYRLYGAKQVRNTLSPGRRLYDEIKTWNHFTSNPKV